jgi:glycosyltransferase involved in cell wall biosynthesis
MLNIATYAIPNLEIIKHTELPEYQYFNHILVNNHCTLDFFTKHTQYKQATRLLSFSIMSKYFKYPIQSSDLNLNLISKSDSDPKFKLKFFCLGGLNSITRKNIDKIYKAFEYIPKSKASLDIYIQGNEVPRGISNTENIQVSVGSLSYEEIGRLYRTHHIVIHMGSHEGLGLGYYEAIASGIPIIGMDCPPCNEIVKWGWLVPCQYQEMIDNPNGLVRKGVIDTSDLTKTIKQAIEEYSQLIAKPYYYSPHQYIKNIRHLILGVY